MVKQFRRLHLYEGDGIQDHKGEDRCMHCGLPKKTCVNRLPDIPAEAKHIQDRMLGETQ